MAVKEKKKTKKTNKTKQKGGLKHEILGVLRTYFIFFLKLLNIYNEAFKDQFNNKLITNKIDKLKKENNEYPQYYDEFQELSINIDINPIINSIIKILTLLFSIKTINETDNFISKILKIYRHKLFIDYLNQENDYKMFIIKSFTILKNIPLLGKSFIDSFLFNKTISSSIREIRKLFLDGFNSYFKKVPVIYGGKIKIDIEQNNNVRKKIVNRKSISNIHNLPNNYELSSQTRILKSSNNKNEYIGYNEYICKIVSIFSKKKRVFIINPLVALMCKLFSLVSNIQNGQDYDTKLKGLIYKLLKLDGQYFEKFPNIEYLQKRKKFCIIKENSDEIIKHDKCSFAFGCSLGMTAEIREENLPSDEDIFEFLNILLYISFESKDILIKFYKQLENAEQSENAGQSENANRLQNAQQSENAQQLQHNYFEGIFELLLQLNQFKNILNQLNYLMSINRARIGSNNRVFKNQQNVRQQTISTKLNEILLNPKIKQLEQLYNYVESQLQQPNVELLQVSTHLIQEIIILLQQDESKYQQFLLFLEKKNLIEKLAILKILQ